MNWLRVGILLAAVVLGGCASTERGGVTDCPEQAHHAHHHCQLACAPPRPATGLIFDRQPGAYRADQFAYRSEWPSTMGYLRTPETIFYREDFYDIQGPGLPMHDYTYRRFQTLRFGAAVR